MKNVLNLDAYGVEEMTTKEMVKVEGGSLLLGFLAGYCIVWLLAALFLD